MKILGWERDLTDPRDWLELLVLIPFRSLYILNYRPEGGLIRQGLNFTWARGPGFILRLNKWQGRFRYRINISPHWIFGHTVLNQEPTEELVAVNTKVKSSPIDRSKPSCFDQKKYYEIVDKMKTKHNHTGN